MITSLRLTYWFGQIDSRPLSLFRIAFGALLLKQALYLIPVAQLFYSDDGIVPRARFWPDAAQAGLGQFSILNYVGASWGAILIFSLWAVIALALLVGYRTRMMVGLNYLLWLSLLHRNPFVFHAPDHVMLLLSFWMIFLPLNHHYSMDRWLERRRSHNGEGQVLSLPTVTYAFPLCVIQIQVALIYIFTSYYKWQGLFWRTGDALFYTLQQESFLLPTGIWLGVITPLWLLRLLTWTTLLIETSFALLVFAPIYQPWARAAGLLLAALFHLGIGASMAIPDFSLVMVISHLLFFDPTWVEWLERKLCRLLRLSPTSTVAAAVDRWSVESRRDSRYIGRGGLTILLTILLTATIWGGLIPERNIWNKAARVQPRLVRTINQQLHLASPWTMFAYYTRPRSGWLWIDGQFENGAKQLLYTSRAPDTGQISRLWGPAARLRFFEQRLLWSFPETILHAWGEYYCRRYDGSQAQTLITVEIYRRYQWVHEPGTPPNPYEDDLLWRHQCLLAPTQTQIAPRA